MLVSNLETIAIRAWDNGRAPVFGKSRNIRHLVIGVAGSVEDQLMVAASSLLRTLLSPDVRGRLPNR